MKSFLIARVTLKMILRQYLLISIDSNNHPLKEMMKTIIVTEVISVVTSNYFTYWPFVKRNKIKICMPDSK